MEIKKEDLKETATDPAAKPEAKTGQETPEQKLARLEAENKALAEAKARAEADKANVEKDRDNYRQGLLSEKAKKIDLFGETPAYVPKPKTKVDEYGDEVEEEDKITPAVEKVLAVREGQQTKQNQTIALKRWMQSHPELADDALRGSVLDEFVSRSGKSVEGIFEDLNRAYGYYKFSRGISDPKPAEKPVAPAFNPGSPSPSSVSGGYTEAQKQLMSSQDISPEKFEEMKKRVLDGTLNLPDDVVKVILNKDVLI